MARLVGFGVLHNCIASSLQLIGTLAAVVESQGIVRVCFLEQEEILEIARAGGLVIQGNWHTVGWDTNSSRPDLDYLVEVLRSVDSGEGKARKFVVVEVGRTYGYLYAGHLEGWQHETAETQALPAGVDRAYKVEFGVQSAAETIPGAEEEVLRIGCHIHEWLLHSNQFHLQRQGAEGFSPGALWAQELLVRLDCMP